MLVVRRKSSVEPVHKIPLFYLRFHAKSLSLAFLYKVTPSASACFTILSLRAFRTDPAHYVLILMRLPTMCEHCALTA